MINVETVKSQSFIIKTKVKEKTKYYAQKTPFAISSPSKCYVRM